MNNQNPPNAPAFFELQKRMDLRDYLAAKAMAALISTNCLERASAQGVPDEANIKALAFSAYELSDAMLAERNREAKP